MIKVVIDTNVLISSLIVKTSPPGFVYDRAMRGVFCWYTSDEVLAEYNRVLSYTKFEKYFTEKKAREVLAMITKKTKKVTPVDVQKLIDPTDTKFLACAVAAKVDFLITGNLKHYPETYKGVKVVSPAQFVEYVGEGLK